MEEFLVDGSVPAEQGLARPCPRSAEAAVTRKPLTSNGASRVHSPGPSCRPVEVQDVSRFGVLSDDRPRPHEAGRGRCRGGATVVVLMVVLLFAALEVIMLEFPFKVASQHRSQRH